MIMSQESFKRQFNGRELREKQDFATMDQISMGVSEHVCEHVCQAKQQANLKLETMASSTRVLAKIQN